MKPSTVFMITIICLILGGVNASANAKKPGQVFKSFKGPSYGKVPSWWQPMTATSTVLLGSHTLYKMWNTPSSSESAGDVDLLGRKSVSLPFGCSFVADCTFAMLDGETEIRKVCSRNTWTSHADLQTERINLNDKKKKAWIACLVMLVSLFSTYNRRWRNKRQNFNSFDQSEVSWLIISAPVTRKFYCIHI